MLLWMAAIFYISGQTKETIPAFGTWDLLVKKGSHFIAYAVLFWLAKLATGNPVTALIISVLYAMSDEYHQSFVVGRNGQWQDVIIDSLGAFSAFMLMKKQNRRT